MDDLQLLKEFRSDVLVDAAARSYARGRLEARLTPRSAWWRRHAVAIALAGSWPSCWPAPRSDSATGSPT